MGERERGRVRWFNVAKGYGRITPEASGDLVFVHFSQVRTAGHNLVEGDLVEYARVIQPGPHGVRPVAVDVVVLDSAAPSEERSPGR